MILTALKEYAEREGLIENPHYESKAVHYCLALSKEGKCLSLTPVGMEGNRHNGMKILVPRPLPGFSRRSGVVVDPLFLVDKSAFVFGQNTPELAGDKLVIEKKLRDQRSRFSDLITTAAKLTKDEGLIAVQQFLSKLDESPTTLPAEIRSNHLITFLLQDDVDCYVHQRPAVQGYLNTVFNELASNEGQFQCLVTGAKFDSPEKHPLTKRVPGGSSSGIAFVTFNKIAFESYGLTKAENAPVSRDAANAYTEAIKRLLSDDYPNPKVQGGVLGSRNIKLSENTVVVYWSQDDKLVDLFQDAIGKSDPNAVTALLKATWKGQPIDLDNPAAFYALTLSGAEGRGTVRGWHESTLGAVVRNVRTYFKQLKLAPDEGRPQPLLNLLRQTAVLGKLDNIAPNLAGDVFQAILSGRPFPRSVLEALIRRARAERELLTDRVSFIKAYLCRTHHLNETDSMLVEDSPSPSYRLGRLFAVLEKLQEEAISANASIRDRYYGAASSTPVVVFPQLLRKAPHHLSKLHAGRRTNFEKLLQTVCEGLLPPVPFPSTLKLEEQGLFAVGYYHQRQALFTKKETEPTTDSNTPNQE